MFCNICQEEYSNASFGGPGICPSCDCGIPPQVRKLTRENALLRVENMRLAEQLRRALDVDRPRAEITVNTIETP